AASNVLSNVNTYFPPLPGKISGYLSAALSYMKTWAPNIANSAKTAASNCLSNVTSYFSQMPSKVQSSLSTVTSNVSSWGSSLVSSFTSIGKNVIQGMINGIGSMVSSLYSSIKSSLSGLVDKAKNALGISSPSKVFADEVGAFVPPGIGEGIEDAMPALEAQTEDQLQDMVKKMKVAVDVETDAEFKGQKAASQRRAENDVSNTEINNDNHVEQTNNYYVPVATPSETSKAQREAARKLVGGVQ
ncbi:MAG: hypothetical protein LUD50_06170, partial [Clostridia bacterium]|nr:hypothetical protein [Clostridia bacterium]